MAVGLSGGVDSAVTAALLKERGYEVTGVYLDAWDHGGCEVDKDRRDALLVASKLKIPFKVLDVKREYKKRVIDYFFKAYEQGLTPNPDILCNSEIKFGIFYDWAMKNGFDRVATGHYALVRELKIKDEKSRINDVFIQRGKDRKKDQSYFLWRVEPEKLDKILFPLGNRLKSEVRAKAKELKLPVADKPDSMGICFIGDVDVRKMLKERLGEKEGEVVIKMQNAKCKMQNCVVGRHQGLWFYTIGQRGGFEVDKKKLKELGWQPEKMKPLYVMGKDVERNVLIVGEKVEVFSSRFTVHSSRLLMDKDKLQTLVEKGRVFVRMRNLGELYRVSDVRFQVSGLEVEMEREIFGVAPGQSAVFYWRWNGVDGDEVVVGGGVVV